ncbi:MAG: gamma-glutamyl-gamma-aminobutyrate hydrolase family protein [Wenzhouxiangella sp.]
MKRIGITQRIEFDTAYAERRDCLDHQWFQVMETLGFCGVPIPNNLVQPRTWLNAMHWDGFILSGGNDVVSVPGAAGSTPERARTEQAILDLARERTLPVFGVCRGLQMLNVHLGGSLSTRPDHVACRHALLPCAGFPHFSAFREVNSFHGMVISSADLAGELVATAHAPDGSVEAAEHRSLPWSGIMWHPEREAPLAEIDLALMRHCFESG